jgi:hypothetical protein
VFDQMTAMMVMTAQGKFVRAFTAGENLGLSGLADMRFSDGSLIGIKQNFGTTPGSPIENEYLHLDSNGKLLNGTAGPHLAGIQAAGRIRIWAPWSSAASSGDMFYFAFGKAYELLAYSPAGTLVRIVRLDRTPRAVSSADIEAFKESRIRDSKESGGTATDFSNYTFAERYPAISDLHGDRAGNVWARDGDWKQRTDGDDLVRWLVFDSTGAFVATVDTPSRLRISDIGRDYVLGTCSGSDATRTVCMYTLLRTQ